jgi:hypothetical protein
VQHLQDLLADQLLPFHQGAPERLDQRPVQVELLLDGLLGLLEEPVGAGPAVGVGEHLGDHVALVEALLHGHERDQRVGHAQGPDHLGGDAGGPDQVAARPGGRLAEPQLLGGHAGTGDPQEGQQLGSGPGPALLAVVVGQQAEGVLALDDREDLEAAATPDR